MIDEKIKELERQINYLNQEDKSVITKAINFSKDAHLNQTRHSGDPFVTHPIEVAKILTSIKLDASSIAAGLLHDTVEDTKITNDSIKNVFGDQISHLVQGLTKINKLRTNNPFSFFDKNFCLFKFQDFSFTRIYVFNCYFFVSTNFWLFTNNCFNTLFSCFTNSCTN